MPVITLPDGAQRAFDQPVSGAQLAAAIGPGLAKAALALKVDGTLRDLGHLLERDARVEIVTTRHPDALELLRHDAAHVLAEAAKELYPDVQVTFGPATDDGFYYDFARETPFTPEDLAKLEQRMHEIVDRDEPITREVWSRGDAIRYFKDIGEKYKAEHIETLPQDEVISIYRQGQWLDLCLGPHLPSTAKLGHAFKLLRISGAYWRGDSKNQQLQRVYGTAWEDEKRLKAYLTQLEEAGKRDHRRLGRELDLFHQQEEAVGSTFWHPAGWTLYRTVEAYMRRRLEAGGYLEVKTPQLYDRSLWEASGHWEKFRENMFIAESEDRVLAVKPMNCPGHIQIFSFGQKSYRDLPLRMAEFGACHRYEPSGALHGLMRVRAFTQDDAHIFCREDQIVDEVASFIELATSIHEDFGLTRDHITLGTRPSPRAGTDEFWDMAETQLLDAARKAGVEPVVAEGDGAFYAPKLDFQLKDAIGRSWTCGTIQNDYVLPERLGAEFVGEDGQKHKPVMLHRAILGSFERFIGVVIENFAGAFPLWLSPVQVVVATITSDADEFALKAAAKLRAAGLRVETDLRNEKINYKVREHSLSKTPIIAVVGRREAEEGKVALRRLGSDGQQILVLDEACNVLALEAQAPDVRRKGGLES